jgi:hypothetical protein
MAMVDDCLLPPFFHSTHLQPSSNPSTLLSPSVDNIPQFRNYSRHRKTPRARILEEITRLELQLFIDASENDTFKITPLFLRVLYAKHFFKTNRYLNPRTSSVIKSPTYRDEVLCEDNGRVFQEALRVTPQQFDYVVKTIQDHPVFQRQGK